MKVTIVGYGNMGSALAGALQRAGHQVTLTGKDLNKARKIAGETGATAKPSQEAAKDAELIIAAAPFEAQAEALRSLGAISGKVVVDISNPVNADMSGLAVGHTTSAAEEVAKQVPGIKVVKAFNTSFAQVLQEGPNFKTGKGQIFFAGDADDAKAVVRNVIESLGFEAMDAGPLANSRYLEPMGMLNIWFGYMAKRGTTIAPVWASSATEVLV